MFTALAFLTVAIKGKGRAGGKKSDEIQKLAELIDENVVQVVGVAESDPEPPVVALI
jgi:hypothetical protein